MNVRRASTKTSRGAPSILLGSGGGAEEPTRLAASRLVGGSRSGRHGARVLGLPSDNGTPSGLPRDTRPASGVGRSVVRNASAPTVAQGLRASTTGGVWEALAEETWDPSGAGVDRLETHARGSWG